MAETDAADAPEQLATTVSKQAEGTPEHRLPDHAEAIQAVDAGEDTTQTVLPVKRLKFDGQFQLCAARRDEQAAPTQSAPNTNFWRFCAWAADGVHIIAAQDDDVLQVLRFAQCARDTDQAAGSCATPAENGGSQQDADTRRCAADAGALHTAARLPQTESIYSCACYPHFDVRDAGSTCVAASCRGQPVHLWDAFSGKNRATYRTYDHTDEVATAHCLCFHPCGDRCAQPSCAASRCLRSLAENAGQTT